MPRLIPILCASALLPACASAPARPDAGALRQQVMETERAFARTMAVRDLKGFESFLSSEAVFLGGKTPLRGKQEVVEGWRPLYEKPEAPFSWEPDAVHVLDSGTLALSTGPVRDPRGKVIGTFTSIWRLEGPGVWRIVFDTGSEACEKK